MKKPKTVMNGDTTICRHQDQMIAESIAEAKELGRYLQITEAERVATGTQTIASIDASAEQHTQWAQEFIRLLFAEAGTRCELCGHVATGPLTGLATNGTNGTDSLQGLHRFVNS